VPRDHLINQLILSLPVVLVLFGHIVFLSRL